MTVSHEMFLYPVVICLAHNDYLDQLDSFALVYKLSVRKDGWGNPQVSKLKRAPVRYWRGSDWTTCFQNVGIRRNKT